MIDKRLQRDTDEITLVGTILSRNKYTGQPDATSKLFEIMLKGLLIDCTKYTRFEDNNFNSIGTVSILDKIKTFDRSMRRLEENSLLIKGDFEEYEINMVITFCSKEYIGTVIYSFERFEDIDGSNWNRNIEYFGDLEDVWFTKVTDEELLKFLNIRNDKALIAIMKSGLPGNKTLENIEIDYDKMKLALTCNTNAITDRNQYFKIKGLTQDEFERLKAVRKSVVELLTMYEAISGDRII